MLVAMSLADHWPLFGLRIRTPQLELRVPTDGDLEELVDLASRGVHDPASMPFTMPWTDTPSPRFEQEALQYWWRCRAEFSPDSWDLVLAVSHDGELVGVQNLTTKRFPSLRSAETGSWLGLAHQGKGIGKEMRSAVLHLAFEYLEAAEVTSAAFTDNAASQAVSLATGYEPNGKMLELRRGQPSEQVRFRLTRQRWADRGPHLDVEVAGFEACRAMFGLSSPDATSS